MNAVLLGPVQFVNGMTRNCSLWGDILWRLSLTEIWMPFMQKKKGICSFKDIAPGRMAQGELVESLSHMSLLEWVLVLPRPLRCSFSSESKLG